MVRGKAAAGKTSRKEQPRKVGKRATKVNPFDEIDALSSSKPRDRLRLAYLVRKAGHQVHRFDALQKLRKRLDDVLTDTLPGALADRGSLVRVEALEVIAEHSLKSFEPEAILALSDKDALVQDRAVWALAEIKTPTAVRAVKRVLPKLAGKARVSAEAFLYTIDRDKRRLDRLIASLEDEDDHIRMASAHELAYIIRRKDVKRTIEAIEAVIGREQYRVHKLRLRTAIRDLRKRFEG